MSKVLEGLEGEFLPIWLEDFAVFDPEHFSARWIDEENGIQAIYGLKRGASVPKVFVLFFMRDKGWTRSKALDWLGENPEYLPWKIMEALAEAIAKHPSKKTILKLLRNPKPFLPEFFRMKTLDKTNGIYSLLGNTADSSVPEVVALLFGGKAWTKAKVNEWLSTRQGKAYRRER